MQMEIYHTLTASTHIIPDTKINFISQHFVFPSCFFFKKSFSFEILIQNEYLQAQFYCILECGI